MNLVYGVVLRRKKLVLQDFDCSSKYVSHSLAV
jgi:hypothetical protein